MVRIHFPPAESQAKSMRERVAREVRLGPRQDSCGVRLRQGAGRLSFVHQERMVAPVPEAGPTPVRWKPERRRAKTRAA